MFKKRNSLTSALPRRADDEDARFMGWQRTKSGEVIALYNVTATGHPSHGSTLSDSGLRKLNLKIPRTPVYRGPKRKIQVPGKGKVKGVRDAL
jgi:hypothetical protein